MEKQISIFDGMQKTMTVSEVADALNVTERTVLNYTKKVFPGKLKSGVKAYFNETEVTAIKLKLQQNQHLERTVELPKTQLEKRLLVQQAMNILNEEIDILRELVDRKSEQLEQAQPKIEFHDQVETSINSVSVAEYANLLTKNGFKIGQNGLFKWFYVNGYLINSSRPYQSMLDVGLFEIKKVPYKDHEGNDRSAHKILVTGKGQTYFAKKITGA